MQKKTTNEQPTDQNRYAFAERMDQNLTFNGDELLALKSTKKESYTNNENQNKILIRIQHLGMKFELRIRILTLIFDSLLYERHIPDSVVGGLGFS